MLRGIVNGALNVMLEDCQLCYPSYLSCLLVPNLFLREALSITSIVKQDRYLFLVKMLYSLPALNGET